MNITVEDNKQYTFSDLNIDDWFLLPNNLGHIYVKKSINGNTMYICEQKIGFTILMPHQVAIKVKINNIIVEKI